jgi:hypothetical protein
MGFRSRSTSTIRTPVDGVDRTFHVYECFVHAVAKTKYVIPILPNAASWLCLLINSNLTRAQQSRPKLAPCVVALPAATHGFLAWDSYVVVDGGYYLPEESLNHILGAIALPSQRSIAGAVRACPVVPTRTKARVLSHLEGRA